MNGKGKEDKAMETDTFAKKKLDGIRMVIYCRNIVVCERHRPDRHREEARRKGVEEEEGVEVVGEGKGKGRGRGEGEEGEIDEEEEAEEEEEEE